MFNLNDIYSNFGKSIMEGVQNSIKGSNYLLLQKYKERTQDPELNIIDPELWKETVELQNKFNENTVPNWREKKLNWWRAIKDEVTEILNSENWKWWKDTDKYRQVDMKNVEVEMVDLMHFLISLGIEKENKSDFMYSMLLAGQNINQKLSPNEIIEKVDNELYMMAALKSFELFFIKWVEIWYSMGKTFEDLLLMYRVKNALNIIRQKFGYKNGKYIKIWDKINNKEDNDIAWEIAKKMKLEPGMFEKMIQELEKYYTTNVIGL